MQRTATVAVTALVTAAMIAAEAPAQSASSSNPFAGISRLFNRDEAPVTNDEGEVLGPPVELEFVIIEG